MSSVIDQTVVTELRDILGGEVDELLQEFVDTAEEQLVNIEQAFGNNALDQVGEIVHQIKGSASNLGISEFASACKILEEGIRSGEIIRADNHIEIIKHEYHRVVEEIELMHQVE